MIREVIETELVPRNLLARVFVAFPDRRTFRAGSVRHVLLDFVCGCGGTFWHLACERGLDCSVGYRGNLQWSGLSNKEPPLVRLSSRDYQLVPRSLDFADQAMGILVNCHWWHPRCYENGVHLTFFRKVILCAIAAFLASALIQWTKIFVEGADDALNKGYQHRAVMEPLKP
jgi:hypothetical protein